MDQIMKFKIQLKPFGFLDLQFQPSRQASSIVLVGAQSNISFAKVLSATTHGASPFLGSEKIYGIDILLTISNDLIRSKTLVPSPVPKFKFNICGLFFNKYSNLSS